MKLTPLFVAIAIGAASMATPSFAAPDYSSPLRAPKSVSAHAQNLHGSYDKTAQVKTKKPERPRCFAWPGGCTGIERSNTSLE